MSVSLGLVAGVLSYSIIAAKVLSDGLIVPEMESSTLKDMGLSVLWAVASGFCFEKVFDRVSSATFS